MIDNLQQEIRDRLSVVFTGDLFEKFVAAHPTVYDSQDAAHYLAQDLGFDRWPIFGDGEGAFDAFWAQFVPKAQMAGYKIVGMEETVH